MLSILKELYGTIFITEEVYKEYGEEVEDWIKIIPVKDKKYLKFIHNFIDLGEASTIAMALEIDNSVIILDDLKARKIANKLSLNYTGTIGVLLKAREKKIIGSLKDMIEKLKTHNFRISKEIEEEMLKNDRDL